MEKGKVKDEMGDKWMNKWKKEGGKKQEKLANCKKKWENDTDKRKKQNKTWKSNREKAGISMIA